MTDLTKITAPLGLLDAETRAALMATDYAECEVFAGDRWMPAPEHSMWIECYVYRVKPTPPKPREWWAVGLHLHNREADAQRFLAELNAEYAGMDFGQVIRVREVLE